MMSRPYEKKTERRSREERRLSVRGEHRPEPDVQMLTQLLIRFALQDAGEARAASSGRRTSLASASTSS
ncbi:hypothetical protein FM104_13485 [Microbacterium esteraromaticum]|uniref:Uncharacterized protein n=1 Tax=Microbacterium esteraromaticum TaxID=57043 RepID=A0A1R4KJV1_9MICO|nr:hypothetical protein [Microbacterium esteraromaticum]SJN44636.1 hypothetical protein FM104_13485 [Microbacterium esteraromaticum]